MNKHYVEGYSYYFTREELKKLPEFKEIPESDFFDLKPSLMILKIRRDKVFKVFIQTGNYCRQILYFPICSSKSLRLPYEQTYKGIAKYVIGLMESGQLAWLDLLEYYESHHESYEDFIKRITNEYVLKEGANL